MILLVFDIDGTLTNTTDVDNLCFTQTYQNLYKADWKNFNWKGIQHVSDSGLANAYFEYRFNRLPISEEIEKIQLMFMEILSKQFVKKPSRFREIPGAGQLIREFSSHSNYHVAFATGCWKKSAIFKLNAANIPFNNIPLGHADFHYDRALITKEAIKLAQVKFGTDWEHIVYVGDGIWDAQTTDLLKIPLIGVDFYQNGNLKKYGTKTVISHYNEIENFESIIEEAITNFKNYSKSDIN